jgi:hypothetical protein
LYKCDTIKQRNPANLIIHLSCTKTLAKARANQANLSIPLYVRPANGYNGSNELKKPLTAIIEEWQASSQMLRESMDDLFKTLQAADLITERDNG